MAFISCPLLSSASAAPTPTYHVQTQPFPEFGTAPDPSLMVHTGLGQHPAVLPRWTLIVSLTLTLCPWVNNSLSASSLTLNHHQSPSA